MRALGLLLIGLAAAAGAWTLLDDPTAQSESGTHSKVAEDRPSTGPTLGVDRPAESVPEAPVPVSVAPLIAALRSGDTDAANVLREAIKAGTVPLKELLELALLPDEYERVASLARTHVRRLGFDAAPLLPDVFELIEAAPPDAEDTPPESAFAARLLASIAGKKRKAKVRAALRPYLPRARALIEDEDADLTMRLAMLPLVEQLGEEAIELTGPLIAWLRAADKHREDFENANPGACVSWWYYDFDVQDALSALGPKALPDIIDALGARDDFAKFTLKQAIEDMGKEALPALEALIEHDNSSVAVHALTAVAKLRKHEPELFALLRDLARHPRAAIRRTAIHQLRPFGDEAIPILVEALADPSANVRAAAMRRIERRPEAVKAAMPRLLKLMRAGKGRLPTGLLTKLGPAASEAAPHVFATLVRQLNNSYMRRSLVRGSGILGESDEIKALEAFGPAGIQYVVDAALGDDPERREAAVFALGRMSKVDARTVAPLGNILNDLEGVDRMRLAGLLAQLGNGHALRVLTEGLRNDDRMTRVEAARRMQLAGARAVDALPLLIEGLRRHTDLSKAKGAFDQDEHYDLREYEKAVAEVGQHDLGACQTLLGDENENIVLAGANAYARAKEGGLQAVRSIWSTLAPAAQAHLVDTVGRGAFPAARAWTRRQLDRGHPRVRIAACEVLRREKTERDPVVRTYIDLLAFPETAQDAAWRLRGFGAKLAPHEAALRAAQPKQKSTARAWIQDLLNAIDDARPASKKR